MAPRGDKADKSDKDDSMLAIMLEKFEALQADNAEIKARLTVIESGSPKSTHQASVEPPDGGPLGARLWRHEAELEQLLISSSSKHLEERSP